MPTSEVLQNATITKKQKKVSCGRRTRMMGHVRLGLLFERFRYEQSVKNKKVAMLLFASEFQLVIFASKKPRIFRE